MRNAFTSHPKHVKILYLVILIITFGTIYSSVFDKKVSLVGDNASYYILGTALANGEGYTNIHHQEKEAHYHYPPGYPVLIAGVMQLFSDDISTIKIVNGLLFLGSVLLLFFISIDLINNVHLAFVASLLTLLNYHLLTFATIMMSEIPFLFFSLLSLWLFFRVDFTKRSYKNVWFVLLIVCVTFTFYIRSTGLALIVSIAFFLLLKKHWQYLTSFLGGTILLYLPWLLRGQSATGSSYVHQLLLKNPYKPELGTIGFSDIIDRVGINLQRYITMELPSGMISSQEMVYSEVTNTFSEWIVGLLLVSGILLGILKLSKFRMFLFGYLVAFFGLLLLWPSVWYGVRFMLPLIPLLLFLFVIGVTAVLKKIFSSIVPKKQSLFLGATAIVLLGSWAFLYGKNTVVKLHKQAIAPYANEYKNYFELATWIAENTTDETVTCVRKEGLFYLFSKKYVTNYLKITDREAQIEHLREKNVDYVVVEQLGYSSTVRYLVPIIDRYPNKFKVIKELPNPNTYLMQFLPEYGYSGSWENEKRNGFGTYVWEDGQRYEGNWKNDVRHGKGTVYFANGESLSGTWNNGKLEGEAVKKDANGRVLERSIYHNNQKIQVIETLE